MTTSGELSLSEDEIKRFLKVIDSIQHLALFRLELCAGIRREDVVGINIRDIDLEKKELTFWEAKKSRNHTVAIDDCEYAMRMYLNTVPKGQEKLFPFSGKTAYNIFQRYLRKAGITKKNECKPFHILRATFMNMARDSGRSPEWTQQQSGDSARVILEHYMKLSKARMHEEAQQKPLLSSLT